MTLVKGVQHPESAGNNEEWLDSVDRGRLWHVRENTFYFFCALEEEVQLQLKQLAQSAHAARKRMIEAITASDDVQFYWLIVTADFDDDDDEEVKSVLLSMIIELYLTMRGFSFASNWVEKFKQSAKKTTQKSESIQSMVLDRCHRGASQHETYQHAYYTYQKCCIVPEIIIIIAIAI